MPATAMFPQFREIWLVDFEFDFGGSHEQGELPRRFAWWLVSSDLAGWSDNGGANLAPNHHIQLTLGCCSSPTMPALNSAAI